jgi:adenylylsulfate kinase
MLKKTAASKITWLQSLVDRTQRNRLIGHKGATLWTTGLSSSGKSTLAFTMEQKLVNSNFMAYVLDGDNIRHGLNSNLGFTDEERRENIRRVGEVSKLFADAGMIVLSSWINGVRVKYFIYWFGAFELF